MKRYVAAILILFIAAMAFGGGTPGPYFDAWIENDQQVWHVGQTLRLRTSITNLTENPAEAWPAIVVVRPDGLRYGTPSNWQTIQGTSGGWPGWQSCSVSIPLNQAGTWHWRVVLSLVTSDTESSLSYTEQGEIVVLP